MTSGLPDYFRSIRPRYGAAESKHGYTDVTARHATTLCSVSGKGIIYGGAIFVNWPSTQREGHPLLNIDGHCFLGESFEHMKGYGFDKVHSMPLYLLKYSENEPGLDEDKFIYSVGISPGYTFESSFHLGYYEYNGIDLSVSYQVLYALV